MKEIGYIRRIPPYVYNKKFLIYGVTYQLMFVGPQRIRRTWIDKFYANRKEILSAITSCTLFLAISLRILFRANFFRTKFIWVPFRPVKLSESDGESPKPLLVYHYPQQQPLRGRLDPHGYFQINKIVLDSYFLN